MHMLVQIASALRSKDCGWEYFSHWCKFACTINVLGEENREIYLVLGRQQTRLSDSDCIFRFIKETCVRANCVREDNLCLRCDGRSLEAHIREDNLTVKATKTSQISASAAYVSSKATHKHVYIYIYIYTYRGCPRRNVPDFGRVFFMLKYTDITQNTYVQSWTVTEKMAREKCGILAGPRTVPDRWQVLSMSVLQCDVTLRQYNSRYWAELYTLRLRCKWLRQCLHSCVMYSAWNTKDNYDMSASVFVVQYNGFMSLTS
jgi:hypothetical protein